MAATLDWPHPIYIRLAKGGDEVVSREENGFTLGKAILMRPPKEGLFVTTGIMTQVALKACDILGKKGFECGVLHMHTIKPLDHEALSNLLPKVRSLVTVEEHTRIGGLGSAVLEFCNDEMPEEAVKIRRIGIPHRFAEQYGNQDSLLRFWKISVEDLVSAMSQILNCEFKR